MKPRLLLAATFTLAALAARAAEPADLAPDSWPTGSSPREIGQKLAERFVAGPHTNFNRPAPATFITYPEVCTWYGALTFARATGDADLSARLVRRFEPLLTPAESRLVPQRLHVDYSVFGVVPLEIAIENGDRRCLDLGLGKADLQWVQTLDGGLSPQTRYWIDDMFMITALQVQAFRATGRAVYLDRAAREMVAYLDRLQQPNGLFFHAPEAPFFWGRGNGWVAAGMAQLLRDLPADHPLRPRILAGYRLMMAALLRAQDDQGRWHQLIDHPESWPEASSTGMFTFAMIEGARRGWLDAADYGPAARRGWLGLVSFIDAQGAVHETCEGTNKNPDIQYYLHRNRIPGDLHGQAPVLWCATALLR